MAKQNEYKIFSVDQATYYIKIIKLILNIIKEGTIINERKRNHHW